MSVERAEQALCEHHEFVVSQYEAEHPYGPHGGSESVAEHLREQFVRQCCTWRAARFPSENVAGREWAA